MALKVLVISLLCSCVALSSAQSESGDSDGEIDGGGGILDETCDGAKIVYDLPLTTRSSSLIFDDLQKTPDGGSMCSLEKTCCSKTAEEDMAASVVAEVTDRIQEIWNSTFSSCSASVIKDVFVRFLEKSKEELIFHIKAVYLGYYEPEKHNVLFDEFYGYLQEAILTGNSCDIAVNYSTLYYKVYLAILEGHTPFQAQYFPDTKEFQLCLYNFFLDRYEITIYKQFIALTRSFNRTMYYLRALTTVEELFQELLEVRLTPSCQRSLMQMTYCSQCAGHSASTFTCEGMCQNTLRGCLVDYSDLFQPLAEFAEAAVKMQAYLYKFVNPFNHPHLHITVPVISFLSNVTSEQAANFHSSLFAKCGHLLETREARSVPTHSRNIRRDVGSKVARSTLPPPDADFNNSALCLQDLAAQFRNIPDTICSEITSANESCWNGKSIGRYQRDVVNFNRSAQQYNPEVGICSRISRNVQEKLARVRYTMREMQALAADMDSERCPTDDEDFKCPDKYRCNFREFPAYVPRPEVSGESDDTVSITPDLEEISGSGSNSGDPPTEGEEGDEGEEGEEDGGEGESDEDVCLPYRPPPTPTVTITDKTAATAVPTTEPTRPTSSALAITSSAYVLFIVTFSASLHWLL